MGDPPAVEAAERLCAPAADRAKLSLLNTVSRIRRRGRSLGYPQTEGILGDCMLQYGQELGAASEFGNLQQKPSCWTICRRRSESLCCLLPGPLWGQVVLFQVWVKLCTRLLRPEMLWM